ncbi:MAG: hypothetical protein NT098_04840 [Candidatus Parcubacteria bacterium]|nr:hypothetical protein [Candidatus Parcubacteria bacterium]
MIAVIHGEHKNQYRAFKKGPSFPDETEHSFHVVCLPSPAIARRERRRVSLVIKEQIFIFPSAPSAGDGDGEFSLISLLKFPSEVRMGATFASHTQSTLPWYEYPYMSEIHSYSYGTRQ